MSKFFRQLSRSLRQAANTEWSKQTGKRDWKYELSELKDAAYDTFFYSWYGTLRSFFKSLKRTIEYIPVVWNNYDWDHVYLLKIMQYKIQRMRKHHEKVRLFVGVERTIDQLKLCEVLLDRLIKDDYTDELYKQHCDKWYPNQDIFERLKNHLDEPVERREFKQIMDHEEYMRKQDMEYLCKVMTKHYRSWWD
jgi:hypothetical protein